MNPDAATICVPPPGGVRPTSAPGAVTVFLCANCARPARAATSAGRPRPAVPEFGWPWPVQEILVACTGRLQPEHVLKAFESGSDVVCMVACEEDNCHYLEGSKRCARRADYLRSILNAIGLGGERLMLFHLPGTAAEDMALAAGRPVRACASEALDAQAAAIRDQVVEALAALPPNPLRQARAAGHAEKSARKWISAMTTTKSRLGQTLSAGRLAVTAECLPPLSGDAGAVKKLSALLPARLDAVVVADNCGQIAGSALACAAILAAEGRPACSRW